MKAAIQEQIEEGGTFLLLLLMLIPKWLYKVLYKSMNPHTVADIIDQYSEWEEWLSAGTDWDNISGREISH